MGEPFVTMSLGVFVGGCCVILGALFMLVLKISHLAQRIGSLESDLFERELDEAKVIISEPGYHQVARWLDKNGMVMMPKGLDYKVPIRTSSRGARQ